MVVGIAVHHCAVACRARKCSVVVGGIFGSGVIDVAVPDGGRRGVLCLEIGEDFFAHIVGVGVAIPQVVQRQAPGHTAGVVLVIATVPTSIGHVDLIRRQDVVGVPVVQLVVGIRLDGGPSGVACEALKTGKVAHGEVAGISVARTTGKTGGVPRADAAAVGFIGQDRVDNGGGAGIESVPGPSFIRLQQSLGHVHVPICGRVGPIRAGTRNFPIH